MAAEVEAGHVGSNRLIEGIQPLQVRVEVASCPARQVDVVPLDGFPRLNGNFLRVI